MGVPIRSYLLLRIEASPLLQLLFVGTTIANVVRDCKQPNNKEQPKTKRHMPIMMAPPQQRVPLLSQQCHRLYGRQMEMEQLQALLREASSSTSSSKNKTVQIAFVEGPSGSGKTCLLQEVFSPSNHHHDLETDNNNSNNHTPLVVGRAKFEAFRGRQPFAALRQCLVEFVSNLSWGQATKLRNSLDFVDEETLKNFCPPLHKLIPSNSSSLSSGQVVFAKHNNSNGSSSSTFDYYSQQQQQLQQEESNGSGTEDTMSLDGNEDGLDQVTGFMKLKNVLASFFQALSKSVAPACVVWILDDAQWMDETSLAIVQHIIARDKTTIVNSSDNGALLCVVSFRSNQLPDFLATWVESTTTTTTTSAPIIRLQDLSVEAVRQLVSDLVGSSLPQQSSKREEKLAQLVHSCTGGKAFYVLQLLDYLQEKGLLSPVLSSDQETKSDRCWQWDIEQIQSDPVVNHKSGENERTGNDGNLWIVSTRLQQLPMHGQHFLQVAACLGPFFERSMLKLALGATAPSASSEGNYPKSWPSMDFLEEALDQNLIVDAHKFGMFRFSHAKIHEASLELTDSATLADLRWTIGKALWKEALWNEWQTMSSPVARSGGKQIKRMADRILFVCTDLLNQCRDHLSCDNGNERRESMFRLDHLVRLNFEAGRRCSRLNAYVPAVEYLRTAIDLLVGSTESPWSSHNSLMAKLHCTLAEVCLCCGRLDDIPNIVDSALSMTSKMPETFRMRYVALQRLVMTNQISELIDESLVLLSSLGETFAKNTSEGTLVRRRKQLMSRLSTLTDQDILKLPKLLDTSKSAALQIMANILAPVQYFSKHQCLTKIVQLRMVEITLESGISRFSPNCFSFCAFALFDEENKEQFDASIRCSKLGLALAKQADEDHWLQEIAPDALVFRHWTRPYVTDVDDAMSMYEENLKRGDLVTAFQVCRNMILRLVASTCN